MARFLIRNLEDDVHQKLLDMAQSHGQSLEEFVRDILRKVALERTATPNNLGSKIAERFAKNRFESIDRRIAWSATEATEFRIINVASELMKVEPADE